MQMLLSYEIERNYCIYCKQPLASEKSNNYHVECLRLVNKYNNSLFVKIKKWFSNRNFIKKKLNWNARKILYMIIYSVGGINIFIILIYEFLTNLR